MTYPPSAFTKSDFLAHMQRALNDYEQVIFCLTESQMLDTGMDFDLSQYLPAFPGTSGWHPRLAGADSR